MNLLCTVPVDGVALNCPDWLDTEVIDPIDVVIPQRKPEVAPVALFTGPKASEDGTTWTVGEDAEPFSGTLIIMTDELLCRKRIGIEPHRQRR